MRSKFWHCLSQWQATLANHLSYDRSHLKMKSIQMNLCHPWMKWTNYDLQGKIARIEFKHNFNTNIDWYKTSKSYLATNKSKSIVIVFIQCTSFWEGKKKSEVKKNWQFTLLEWTTTCATKLDLFTFSSNNVNTYVWTQIARNKLYNHTSLKNTKFLLSTILKKQWAKKVVMKRPRFLTSHANVSKIYKSTQHKNAHLQRGANDKNINHVLLK
jgi:hypothetical protein